MNTTQSRPLPPPAGRRLPAPPSKQKKWLPYLIVGGSVGVGVLMLTSLVALLLVMYAASPRIASGVKVAGIDIGGQSADSADAELAALANGSVMATDGDRSIPVSLADLGVGVDVPGTLQLAQKAAANTALTPRYTIDLNRAQLGLVALGEQVNIPAVSGSRPENGRAIDIPVVLDRLRVDVNGELADGTLDLTMMEVEPPTPEAGVPYTGVTSTHTVTAGQELGLIAKQYGVDMQDIVTLNNISNPDLLYIGQQLTIPAAGTYAPTQAEAPAPPTTAGKSIVVSTERQRIFAYENGQLVRSHLVSTGLPNTPTVLGDYKIYVEYFADDMAGADYFLPQVPYVMYFYQGYGIHGTYWHNSFGRPMSHGCVNLPVSEAEWFYNWADVGTPVRVI